MKGKFPLKLPSACACDPIGYNFKIIILESTSFPTPVGIATFLSMQELGIMTAPDADPEVLEMLGLESETDGYKKKYLSLRAKCEEMQLVKQIL